MPLTANLFCYLWDLEDEGIDRTLDVIQGELGAQGVTVPVAHSGIEQLRGHDNVAPRWFRSAGGLQFQPSPDAYRSTRARPVAADWLKKRNPLARLSDACRRRGLALHAWLNCCDSPATVAANPAIAVKDAFGEPSTRHMCPLNPDVQEFLRVVVSELTQTYRCDAVELDAFTYPDVVDRTIGLPFDRPDAFPGGPAIGFSSGVLDSLLLSLCFCESCRQAMSREMIDVGTAEQAARLDLQRILRNGGQDASVTAEQYLHDHQPIENLVRWRQEGIVGLVQRLARPAAGGPTVRCVLPTLLKADMSFLQRLGPACDGLSVWLTQPDETMINASVMMGSELAPGAERTWLVVDARTPPVADAAALVRALNLAAEGGVAGVHIFNYGLIAPARLHWTKQAIRYARRST